MIAAIWTLLGEYRSFFDVRSNVSHGSEAETQTDPLLMVASCCNSGMFLKFEPGVWVSSYRLRYSGNLPPIEMRNQTRDRRAASDIPSDAPSFSRFPMRLYGRIIRARIEMVIGL